MIIGNLELNRLIGTDGRSFYAVYTTLGRFGHELVGTVARVPGTKTWEAVKCGNLATSTGFKTRKAALAVFNEREGGDGN
jgi:hypothetical protein